MEKYRKVIPIYNCTLTVYIVDDITELNTKESPEMVEFGDHAVTFFEKGRLCIGFQRNLITAGTIAHEAKHALNHIFSSKGIRPDVFNDEPECYLLGYLVDWIHNVINKNDISWKK